MTWVLYKKLRPQSYRSDDDLRVAERSLENLFSAIRETQRPGRKVLIVLSPVKAELNGREGPLTKQVRFMLARSGFDWLDLHGPASKAAIPNFYYDQVHLDAPGHAFYAEQIAARLREPAGGEPRERPAAAAQSGGSE
jgi:hypothetical protein